MGMGGWKNLEERFKGRLKFWDGVGDQVGGQSRIKLRQNLPTLSRLTASRCLKTAFSSTERIFHIIQDLQFYPLACLINVSNCTQQSSSEIWITPEIYIAHAEIRDQISTIRSISLSISNKFKLITCFLQFCNTYSMPHSDNLSVQITSKAQLTTYKSKRGNT